MTSLLFYNHSNFVAKLIRLRTSSLFDHVELLLNDGTLLTSDPIAGVCRKKYNADSEHTVKVDIPWASDEKILSIFTEYEGEMYDFKGVLLGQLLGADIHDKLGWFCSELCAECLELKESWRYSPQTLLLLINEINNRMLQHGSATSK